MDRHINQSRLEYLIRTTLGKLNVEGDDFCYTLEDTCRPIGVKVKRETAIPPSPPEGYKVGIRYSPSAKRKRLILYTEKDGITLKAGGIKFTYIYPHGGNTHKDSEGCVLVAFNKRGNKIQGTAEKALFNLVAPWVTAGDNVRWHIRNHSQAS